VNDPQRLASSPGYKPGTDYRCHRLDAPFASRGQHCATTEQGRTPDILGRLSGEPLSVIRSRQVKAELREQFVPNEKHAALREELRAAQAALAQQKQNETILNTELGHAEASIGESPWGPLP
jgi:hypothetical protein